MPTDLKPPHPKEPPALDISRFQVGIVCALVAALFLLLAERGFLGF